MILVRPSDKSAPQIVVSGNRPGSTLCLFVDVRPVVFVEVIDDGVVDDLVVLGPAMDLVIDETAVKDLMSDPRATPVKPVA